MIPIFDLPAAPDQELDITLFCDSDELDLEAEFGADLDVLNSGETAAKDSQ